ncbi:hypothetical protein [Actinacidiphila glaucinigra]|uniref:Uncharacterized protein n=1 Tax=Actinacidiphila glaucinigra TaxID=235986 RepID=A0A239IAB6_9ACTN|nr:hypothetical protein [Actinacidiphila glaucinigra]SNS89314.1 hypothetical protein SAMN05216252_11016 [Actinacidiphila glaucinigra]
MPRPSDWNVLGLHGDPTPGDPVQIRLLVDDLVKIGSQARTIANAIDQVMNTADSSVFAGKTADALRGKVDDRLRNHINDVADSFWEVSQNLGAWANHIEDAQRRADGALSAARGLPKDDPQLEALRQTAQSAGTELDELGNTIANAVNNASDIRLPISDCQVFWEMFQILAIILIVPALIFGGPVALLALGVNMTLFVKAAIDFARGDIGFLDLFLAGLGIIAPTTKALPIFAIGGLLKSGFKAVLQWGRNGFLSLKDLVNGFRFATVFTGLRDVARISLTWVRQGGLWVMQNFHNVPALAGSVFVKGGLVVVQGVRSIPVVVRGWGSAIRAGAPGAWQNFRIFAQETWSSQMAGGKWTRLILPVTHTDIAEYGMKGALRMGFWDRGVMGRGVWDLPVGGTAAHTVSAVPMGPHGATPHLDLGHANINMARMDLEDVRFGNFADTHTSVRPSSFSVAPVSTVDLTGLRVGTVNPVSVHGASAVFDNSTAGFRAMRHMDDVVDIAGTQMSRMRIDALDVAPGQMSGGLGVSAAAPGGHVTHSSGLYVPGSAGAPAVHEGVDVSALVAKGNGGNLLAQGPTGVLTAPPGGTGALHAALTGVPAPAPGSTSLHDLLAVPGAPGAGSGAAHTALTGVQAPPSGAGVHGLLGAPGGTPAHGPLTGVPGHQGGTGAAGGSAFDLLSGGSKGTPNNPVPTHIGSDLGDNVAGAARAHQAQLTLDEIVRPAGSGRPGSVVTDAVPGSTAHGVPAPGLPKGGVHGTPPKDAARSALDLLDDGRGVRPVDDPAFAGAPGTGKAVDTDAGHAFAGAPARSTDDVVVTPGTHDKAVVSGDGHVAVPLRQDPVPVPPAASGGGHVLSREADLLHEVNLKLGKMGSGAVTVEAVTAARQVLEDLRGAAFTKVDIRAQADQLAVHLAGPERGKLPGGVRHTDFTDDAPATPGPGGHHAPPVPPRPPRPESGLLDGLDDVVLDDTGAPLGSRFDFDDDSVPGTPVSEHGTEDLDGFSEFVDLIRPLRQHVERALDNPAANIEVALVASPGGRTWREFSDDVGHAMVAVMLPGERKPLTIGFYPEEGNLFGNPGAIVNDAEYLVSGHVRVLGTYRITAAQLFDGYRYAMANSGAVYDLFRYNCVRFAEGFVSAALGKSVADLWVAAPYRLVDTMLRRDGAWHWADGTTSVAKLTADDTIRYQDAFIEVEDWRVLDEGRFQAATDQAQSFVLFDHQRPLIDGNIATVPQKERLAILGQFEKMITHTILTSGDDAGRQLSRQLGETYGTLRPGLSDLPGPSVTVSAGGDSLPGVGRGSVDSVPEPVPSPGGSAAGDSAGHLPPSSVQYPSDVQHMFGEIDDMLDEMGLFRHSLDDLPSGPPSPVHPGTGGGDVHVGTGGDDVVRFMDDTRPVRQHLEHAIADPAADIRLVLGTDGSTGARSLTVLLPGRDAPVPLGPGAPGELGAVRGTADGAPAGGTHVVEEHRITAAQLENAYLYAARNLPLWHTDAGRFTDGFMDAVLDARPAVPDGSAGRAVRDVTADVTDVPPVVGDKGKGKPSAGTLDTTGTGSDHGGVRGNFADDLSEIDVAASITDARRELINARTIRDDLQTRYVDGVGTSAEVDGVRYLESWQQVRQADDALARAEAHWNELTGGAPLPEVQSYAGHGLGGGARLPEGLRSLLHLKGRGDAVPPAPQGVVQSVDHVPSATHVVTQLEGGKLSHALVPSGQDLTVAHWLSEPQSAHGWPKGQGKEAYEGDLTAHQDILTKGLARAEHDDALKSVLLQQQKSFDENKLLFQALEGRTELRDLRMPQLSAIVMAERRAIRTLAADTDQLTTKLRSDEWEWAKGYRLDGAEAGELVTKVHKHLQDELSLTVNLKLGNQLPGGGTLLDAMTADQQLLRNAWEIDNAGAGYYVTRGNTEEALGLPASVKRTTDASGIYPGQGGKQFAPTAADIADLPNYAALTSKYRPSGVKMYGQAVFHLKPNLMERATFTPADSFGQGLEGAMSVTGRGNMLPLLNHGPEPLVRLAFAEATDFQYDSAFRGLRDAGKLEGKLNRYFEAQLHGGVKWDDLDRVVLVNDGFNPAGLQAQKLQLEQFATDKGLSFTVEVHNARPGAAVSAPGAPPAPPGSGGAHPGGTGGAGPSSVHGPGPTSGHPGGPGTPPAPGGSKAGGAVDEVHESYADLDFARSLLDEGGVPRADLFTDTAARVERSGDASFVSPAAPAASGGSAKLTDDQILNAVVGTGGRNGDERRTLGGFEFGAGTRSNDGKNLVSRPIVVTVKDGGTEADVAVHLNVMLSSGNEADVTVTGGKLANTTEVTITGSKFHLTARPHTDQNLIDLHGPSSDTASKSIHVGPSNAKTGWNSRPGNTRNLAQSLGVSEQKLIEALDNRFPPSGLVETIHRFQDDVERAVVHGSGAEDVRVHFQGDKSFPVRGDSGGVSAPAVTGLSRGAGDVLHGGVPGAGRVDLTLDAGWDAARGAAAPNTVKHSWVDPVSTPRGGGAHAPRYEVQAGYDVRRFEVGGRSVTDLTVKVRLAGDGLSPSQVDALWDRAVSGVESVFNRPGAVLRDESVLHVTLERVTGNASDAHLNVNVGRPQGAMNQHQWRIDATEQDLAHELGHQLGLRDEYRDTTAGHRPEVDGSLMGNYHNAAPEGLSQGGLRPRYLDLIHTQVVSHDHVHVPHVDVDAIDGIAPQAPDKNKVKASTSQPAAVPATLTRQPEATRFTQGYQKIADYYALKPLAQYDGTAKGSLQGGEGTRFVATVIATPDTDLLQLARTYGTAFGKESLGERLGLVIGVNGRVGNDAEITDAVRKFAQQWEKEGDFSVSVTGFTWEQPNRQLLADGGQKMVPYGALREAVIRNNLTEGMLDKLKLNSGGEVYLHVGDADVMSMVVGGKPLFERAAAKIEALTVQNVNAPEVVSGGYTLPGGVAKNAADLDLAVRDAMAKTDTRAIYFPEPNTFIRVDPNHGLEKDIRFGEISGDSINYGAREGERLLDSSLKNRGYIWQGRENQGFVFDSSLALVTDGGRIAKEVGDDPRAILSGLTQSHANPKTWTEQIERHIKLHHPDVLVKDANVGKSLAAIAFHDIQADGITALKTMTRKELGKALPAEADALKQVAGDHPGAVRQLLDMAVDTRNALVDGINKRLPQSVSPSAPAASTSTAAHAGAGTGGRLTPDAVRILDSITSSGTVDGSRRTLAGFEFGKVRDTGSTNLISRPVLMTVTEGDKTVQVAVHLNVMVTPSGRLDGTSVTLNGTDFHLTARSKAAQDLIDKHGPSALTADNSIHVGPGNAKAGWDNRAGHLQNLADELGITRDSLIKALDRRFPPGELPDTVALFQRDVERAVVHASASEVITVEFRGDKSFPVQDKSTGVSARAVDGPAGVVDDFFHGAVPGAGRVDLTLDAGWDAARGAAAPNTVKHSWVDPVSTPRGGGAHAPRYEVRAGYDVRRFELGGRPVTDLTVKVRLAGDGLLPSEVDALWDRAVWGVERVFNRPGAVLRDESVLHVTLERVTGNASDAHLNVNVGRPQGAMNQHQWRIDATEQDLAHELGHQLGLRDEYRDTTAGHRPEVDGSLMGNYHNAAPEGLSQGGLRSRYLDLIHTQVAGHDHVHVPHVDVDAVDGIAPHAPGKNKAKPSTSQLGPVPTSFTQRTEAVRFSEDFNDIAKNYRLNPVAQYDGAAKGSLQGGEGTRFVATVIATPDTDLLTLAKTYGTAFTDESVLGERLGLVIGVNGRVGKEAEITDAVRKFAQQWEKEGNFEVSVTGFTWKQPNSKLVEAGAQKEIPYGALREAVIRDDLTRGMLKKVKLNAEGEVYVHVGDADVKNMVVGGKPLFERAAAKIELLSAQNDGFAPEMVSGGYTLPGGAAKNAADLDLAVRDAMAKTDARAIYFPEPNTFVRVDPNHGLEKDIRFGEVSGRTVSYEAREGERLLDSLVKNRRHLWPGQENKAVVFDSNLALVTDGERIALEVGDDPQSLLTGLTQSHANRKIWTEQMEHFLTLHHPNVLVKDANAGKNLAAIAFHDIKADGITTLAKLDARELGAARSVEWKAVLNAAKGSDGAFKQLVGMAMDTRNALVTGINKHLPLSVSAAAPGATRLTGDGVLDVVIGRGGGRPEDARRTLGGFEFGLKTRNNGGNNLISRPIVVKVVDGGTEAEVAVHVNVVLTSSHETRVAGGSSVTIKGSDFHLTARSKAAQDLIDLHGPSILTADNSVHVGPSNATPGWKNNPGHLQNLADELGVSKDSLLDGLDRRFPPGELLDTLKRLQQDVRRTVVHGSATETVTVRWESGDRSFPVLDKPSQVSPRTVSGPAGSVDDLMHAAGAGRVDLTLDAGWDAARGAAAPNTVKHSWVDPVSTPRGGGAHAPRYEVRAGYDVRTFELGDHSVTDLTVRVRLAADGLSPTEVDALWDRAVSGVERVFNRPGAVLRDESVLHVTLERVTGNASDAHLNVNVGGSRGAMNQHQWRIDATEQDLAHELGHQLGLRDEYRDTTAGHRPEVDGSLMGNYHNAAPEGLSQGGLRPRYLDLIHGQVASHDHVHVPHLPAASDDVIAAGGSGAGELDLLDPAVFKAQTSGSGAAIDAVERRLSELHDVHGTDLAGRISALDELTAAADDFLTAHRGAPGVAGVERMLVQVRAESGAYRLLQERAAFGTGHGGGVAALDDLATRVRAVLAGDDLTQATRVRLQDALTGTERQAGALRLLAGNDVPAASAPAPAAAGRDATPGAGTSSDLPEGSAGSVTRVELSDSGVEGVNGLVIERIAAGDGSVTHRVLGRGFEPDEGRTVVFRDGGFDVRHTASDTVARYNESGIRTAQEAPLRNAAGDPNGLRLHTDLNGHGRPAAARLAGPDAEHHLAEPLEDGTVRVTDTRTGETTRHRTGGHPVDGGLRLRGADGTPAEGDLVLVREDGTTRVTDVQGRDVPRTVTPLEDGAGFRITDDVSGASVRHDGAGRLQESGLSLTGADGGRGDLFLARDGAGTHTLTNAHGVPQRGDVTVLPGDAGFRIIDDGTGATSRHTPDGRWQDAGTALADPADGARGARVVVADGAGGVRLTDGLGRSLTERVTDVGGGRFRTFDDTTGRSVLHDVQGRHVETGTALAGPVAGTPRDRIVVPDAAGGHRLTDATGAALPERVRALPGNGGFRVTHATGYRTFAPDGAFTGDGLRLTGRGGVPAGHLDRAAGGGQRWLDEAFAPDAQRAVTVHGNGHIEIARPGNGHQVFHGTTGELVQEVTPLPGGTRQVTAADGSFARHDEDGALTAHGTPLPDEAGGRVLVTRAPSADEPNGAHWLEDPAGNTIRHWNATGQPAGGVRIECTLPGGPRRGEFLELDPDGVVVRQGFNVLDKGRTTPYQYVLDHGSSTWARTGGADGAPRGVFHHGTADLTGVANGRVVLLSATGAPVPVFERRVLPGGGLLDSFRRTDTIAFGRTNPRTSWARWGDEAALSGSGIREYDTAGTGWRDLDGRGDVVHEYQAGLQKHTNGTGHTLALRDGNGDLRWHRYDGAGKELAEGPRTPDRFDSGWTDLADDGRTLVQRKWGMGRLPEHAGQYEEHKIVPDTGAPGGWRTDGTWQRQSPHGKEVGKAEVVDGHLLVTERWREQRPPVWVRRGLLPGAGDAEGAYAHVLGDNAYQMFTWEKRPIGAGTGTSGVRYVGLDGGVLDLTADGRFARLTTKLHDGTALKVGDHAARPDHAPAAAGHQPWEAGQSRGYRVPQDPAATGLLWRDEYRDAAGVHVVREGLPGGVVREYTTPRAVDAAAGHGTWVTRDAHGNLTGMRQPNPDGTVNSFIEGVGKTDSAKWTWREVDAEGTPLGASGTRKFFRGSSDPKLSWDDSFRDRDAGGRLVRERRMLDKGRYVQAWRDPADGNGWLTAAYDRTGRGIDPGPGRQVRSWWNGTSWQDQWSRGARHFRDELRPLPGTQGATVRLREVPVGLGGPLRVREYDPAVATPHSVWKEFDHESVVRERQAVRGADGTVTGYLETDAWRGQWNRYDADGGLVAQRTDSGLVWERGPLGQMRLVGNEYDYRGALTEIRGWGRRIREAQRMPWSGTVVPDGAGAALREARYEPYWRTVAYKAAVEFGQEFVLEFAANLVVNAIVDAAQHKKFTGDDVLKAFANAAVSSGVKTGFGIAVHENRIPGLRNLGNLKSTLANVDGGKHAQRRPFNHDKTWTNEWAGNETPTRWRGGIYDFAFSAGTSVISGWFNGAMNAAVWGVSDANGTTHHLKGDDAWLDGGINAMAALTTSASTALVKNVLVLGGGSRLFHRQGFADFWIQLPFKIFEKSIQSVYLTGAYRASINPSWYQVPPAGTQ